MGNYKGITIPDELIGVIEHMDKLEADREELSVLSQQWDLLTILGQMSGSGTDMSKTREDFKHLTSKLLSVLGVETLNKTVQSLTAKAQVAVDIVIRNLFERTADIGFLATDEDIRSFIRGHETRESNEEQYQVLKEALQARFAEYVSKYSVYDNIILMGCDGEVICQHDESNPVIISSDGIIKEALETKKEFVEVFRPSDLASRKSNALMYGFRVRESNDPASKVIGVLVLVFRFENEMEGVFGNLIEPDDWSILSLVDKDGRVIACSDAYQIPLNSKMELVLDEDFKIAKFGGRLYISKTCPTKGYQGFMGLGWHGHAMIPLEYAFKQMGHESAQTHVDPQVLESVTDEPRLFSEELRGIPRHAESIQSELDRTVWNGNLGNRSADQASGTANKVLLWEISVTGNKTKSVFEKSIRDLHETVVNSILSDVSFVSSLAIDIMDRNLYERANDCRWWALTTDFRKILSEENKSAEDIARMSKVLSYINGLYTVYTNILVFDQGGRVLAVSNPAENHAVGKVLSSEYIRATLATSGSQHYRVSPFEKSEFYQNRHTYIYSASITHTSGQGVVGGIGIVFDSEPQFQKILEDSLPRNEKGQIHEGCFGLFVDREGNIISSTNKALPVGGKFSIDSSILQLGNGEESSKIVKFDGQYFALGASCSQGYREYKNEKGGYRNDVIAVTMFSLGQVREQSLEGSRPAPKNNRVQRVARMKDQDYVEIASFYVGGAWLAVKTSEVQGAIIVNKITRMPLENQSVEGTVMFGDRPIYLIHPGKSKGAGRLDTSGEYQVVVLSTEFGPVGVVVDGLGEIPEIPASHIVPNQFAMDQTTNYVKGIVRPDAENSDASILLVLDPTGFVKTVIGSQGTDAIMSQFAAIGGEPAPAQEDLSTPKAS